MGATAVLSIDKNFDPALKVNVLSSTIVRL